MIDSHHSRIDWDDAKRRIAQLGELLKRTESYSVEDAEAVLYLRAQLLAQEAEQPEDASNRVEVIMIGLAGEHYAIETTVIREVIRPAATAVLPGTESYVAGVMNLRGRPLLIVDARKLLGLTCTELTDSARVVIIGLERAEFGLLTESTEVVKTIDAADIREAPKSLPDSARRLMRGVTSDAIIMLDSESLMNDPRLWIDEKND